MQFFIARMALCFLVVASTVASATAQERQLSASGSGGGYVGSADLSGRGEATHLGRSSLNVGVYTDFLSSGLFFSPGGRLESASRDSLDFIFDEEAYYFDPATGVVNATVTFTGGTGRFQDVSGSADVLIVFELSFFPDLYFHFVVDGSIDY